MRAQAVIQRVVVSMLGVSFGLILSTLLVDKFTPQYRMISASDKILPLTEGQQQTLRYWFRWVQTCMDTEAGRFDELVIYRVPSITVCAHRCDGLYDPHLKMVLLKPEMGAWRHEVVHYLLHKTTGDPHPEHDHEAFSRCGS